MICFSDCSSADQRAYPTHCGLLLQCICQEWKWTDVFLLIDYCLYTRLRDEGSRDMSFWDDPFMNCNYLNDVINLINYLITELITNSQFLHNTPPWSICFSCGLVINLIFLWSCNQSNNSLKTQWKKSGDAIQYITPPKTFQEKYEENLWKTLWEKTK